ncbi:DUF1622 domain-containing protein [Planctomycetota bacterium]
MQALHYISLGIGIIGIAVIVWGVLRTLVRGIVLESTRCRLKNTCCEREGLRREFGSYLLLALEFLIAADIVGTISHPTLEEVALLGSIVAIRTVISFFLNREIQIAREHEKAMMKDAAANKTDG